MLTCDVCRTEAITWRHATGALCDCCKRMIEQGEYRNHPSLPAGLWREPNGSYQLVPFPDGIGAQLTWVPA